MAEIGQRAATVAKAVEAVPVPDDALVAMRRRFLLAQLVVLSTRVRMLSGEQLTFDYESEALYGARAPRHTEGEFEAVLADVAFIQYAHVAQVERELSRLLVEGGRRLTTPKPRTPELYDRMQYGLGDEVSR